MEDLFIQYPRTYHLHGSQIASNDKMLSLDETRKLLARKDVTFVWESKLDGSNVAISFIGDKIFVQNRSHYLGQSGGEHPQYNMLRAWSHTVGDFLRDVLGERYVLFGEWCYAVHTIRYTSLKHYLNEFDIWDRQVQKFLDTSTRNKMLEVAVGFNVLQSVPVVHVGNLTIEQARDLMNHKPYYGEEKPEGLYLKVEQYGYVVGRYKLVRDEFIQTIIDGGDHWAQRPIEVQGLAPGVNIFDF